MMLGVLIGVFIGVALAGVIAYVLAYLENRADRRGPSVVPPSLAVVREPLEDVDHVFHELANSLVRIDSDAEAGQLDELDELRSVGAVLGHWAEHWARDFGCKGYELGTVVGSWRRHIARRVARLEGEG